MPVRLRLNLMLPETVALPSSRTYKQSLFDKLSSQIVDVHANQRRVWRMNRSKDLTNNLVRRDPLASTAIKKLNDSTFSSGQGLQRGEALD